MMFANKNNKKLKHQNNNTKKTNYFVVLKQ